MISNGFSNYHIKSAHRPKNELLSQHVIVYARLIIIEVYVFFFFFFIINKSYPRASTDAENQVKCLFTTLVFSRLETDRIIDDIIYRVFCNVYRNVYLMFLSL